MIRSLLLSASMIKGASILLGLVTASVFSTALGDEDYGRFVYWVSLLMVFSTLISGGAPRLVTRFTLNYFSSRREARGSYLFSFFYGKMLILGLLSCVTYIVALSFPSSGVCKFPDFIWLILFAPAVAFSNISSAYLKGIDRPIKAALPNMVLQSIVMLLGFVAVLSLGPYQLARMMQVYAFSILFTALCYWFFISRSTLIFLTYRAFTRKNIWTRSLPSYFATTLFSTLQIHIAALMIGFFLEPEYNAHFRIAEKMTLLVGLPLVIINMIIGPRFSVAINQRNYKFIFRVVVATGCFSFFGFILTFVLVEFVFHRLFAPDVYAGAKEIVYFVALAPLINCLFGPIGYVMQIAGQESVLWNSQVVTVLISCSIGVFAIPLYGIMGSVIASVLSMLAGQLYVCYFFTRYVNEVESDSV